MTAVLEADIALEKTPLERYVPPAKPSLVGLTRAALAEALGAVGVAPSQQKMRVQQLWHWIYVRGVQSFDEMTSVSKQLRADLDAHVTLARLRGAPPDMKLSLFGNPGFTMRAVVSEVERGTPLGVRVIEAERKLVGLLLTEALAGDT